MNMISPPSRLSLTGIPVRYRIVPIPAQRERKKRNPLIDDDPFESQLPVIRRRRPLIDAPIQCPRFDPRWAVS